VVHDYYRPFWVNL